MGDKSQGINKRRKEFWCEEKWITKNTDEFKAGKRKVCKGRYVGNGVCINGRKDRKSEQKRARTFDSFAFYCKLTARGEGGRERLRGRGAKSDRKESDGEKGGRELGVKKRH